MTKKATFKLEKDSKFNLSKDNPTLSIVRAELSWNTPDKVFPKYDLDVSVFGLTHTKAGPKLALDDYFVYYNHHNKDSKDPSAPIITDDQAIIKSPDETEGGIEWVKFNLPLINSSVEEMSIIITIHDAERRKQTFNQVKDASIRIINDETNEVICEYDLGNEFADSTAVQVGAMLRDNNEWSFAAIGAGYQIGLSEFIEGYTS